MRQRNTAQAVAEPAADANAKALGKSGPRTDHEQPSTSAPSAPSPSRPPPAKKSGLATALSGSVSGMVASSLLQPFDVLRTTMQSSAANGDPLSVAQAFGRITGQGGVATFWRGTQATVVRLGLGAGLHFFCLESIRSALEREQADGSRRLSNLAAMASGGLSRALASALLCPVTVVKTRMENVAAAGTVQKPGSTYSNVGQALVSIARTEGPRGLFRGLVPTVLATAPFSAFYYLFYTRLKEQLAPHIPNATAVNATSSTMAAMGATLLTQPMDVIRTRMQLGTGVSVATTASGVPTTAGFGVDSFKALGRIVRKEGAASLLVGIGPRFFKRTLQSALVWTLYEELLPRLTALSLASTEVGPVQLPPFQLPGAQSTAAAAGGKFKGGVP